MIDISNQIHIVQSQIWGKFKTEAGTPAVRVGDLQFSKHKIPFLPYYIGYAPKVNFMVQNFDWDKLKQTAVKENCVCIRFDVPNVLSSDEKIINDIRSQCVVAPRSTFAKWNVLLDITPDLETLEKNLHQKARYNIKLATKKGVTVKLENNEKGIEVFNKLMKETAQRQGFLPHPENYYKKAFETLQAESMANILIGYLQDEPLTAWMLFNDHETFYYPYGASSREHKNLMASNLVAWEAIKLAKSLNCKLFDMWGATNNTKSAWWGFTEFKLKYGGELVEYMDSYDFVCNKLIYNAFNIAYNTFWKIRKLILRYR